VVNQNIDKTDLSDGLPDAGFYFREWRRQVAAGSFFVGILCFGMAYKNLQVGVFCFVQRLILFCLAPDSVLFSA